MGVQEDGCNVSQDLAHPILLHFHQRLPLFLLQPSHLPHHLTMDATLTTIKIVFLTVIPMIHLAPRFGYLMVLTMTALPCGEIVLEIYQAVVSLLNALVMASILHASHL